MSTVDRCPKNSGLSRGGGVLIATRSHFDFSLLEFVSLNTLTQINNNPNESNRILDFILVSTDYLTKLFPPDCRSSWAVKYSLSILDNGFQISL